MEFTDSTGRKVELSWKQTKLVISAGQTIGEHLMLSILRLIYFYSFFKVFILKSRYT